VKTRQDLEQLYPGVYKARATVVRRVEFDAAHFLPNYEGKCKNLHGHHWVVELGVEGEIDPKTGMVVDFSELKAFWEDNLEGKFDHRLLNDTLVNPTAENLAYYILSFCLCNITSTYSFTLAFVRVWETTNSYCEVRSS